MRAALDRMRAADATSGARTRQEAPGLQSPGIVIELRREAAVAVAELREDIAHGQVVASYTLERRASPGAPWQPFSAGTTIGHCRLDRFTAVTVSEVRLTIPDALISPRPVAVRLFAEG